MAGNRLAMVDKNVSRFPRGDLDPEEVMPSHATFARGFWFGRFCLLIFLLTCTVQLLKETSGFGLEARKFQ